MFGEDDIHRFHWQRSMGHAATPQLHARFKKLAEGTLETHLKCHTDRVAVLKLIDDKRQRAKHPVQDPTPRSSSPSPSQLPPTIPVDAPPSLFHQVLPVLVQSESSDEEEEKTRSEQDELEDDDDRESGPEMLSRLDSGPELVASIDPLREADQ